MNDVPIHPPVNALTACQKCGECCKRYAISALPHELAREAAFFKLSEPRFTAIYGRLIVQVLPFSSGEHPLALHTSMIPKPVWDKLRAAGFEGEYAMILPMIGFKKDDYCVFFDAKTFGCTMHLVKPMQCTLFPFTSLNENEDYSKAYDFCELSKITTPTSKTSEIQLFHRAQWKTFFDTIALQGLDAAYAHWPAEGDVVFGGKKIFPITQDVLRALVKLAREKKTNGKPA